MSTRLLTWALVSVCLALVAACGSSPAPAPAPAPQPVAVADNFNGHWEGAARLATPVPDAPEQMDIVAVIADEHGGAQCGTIEYSHAGCSGMWACSRNDGTRLYIQETIRFGEERCPSGAQIELTTTNDPNVLEFRYSHPAIQAAGQLNRRAIQ